MEKMKLIEVKNLKTYFYTNDGICKAVDGVDFEIFEGETFGIVGESGCGKSVTSLSIMGLIPERVGKIVDGAIIFNGCDLVKLGQKKIRTIRGNQISMIFQEPMTSLDPVFTIGAQISEAIMTHKKEKKKQALKQSVEMLKKVGIPLAEQRVNEYPHQLSGGMRQRVMIAMALSCEPKLLIADEPTTALDVTIQAQILDLIKEMQKKYNMTLMIITHDMGVIAEITDRVAVMYAGKIVEYADTKTLFSNPLHPYTLGLMNSIPRIDKEMKRLITIPGVIPDPYEFPKGCKFNSRCALADAKCLKQEPRLVDLDKEHKARCWHFKKINQLKNKLYSIK